MSGPYAAPPNMQGYEPPSHDNEKKNYPTQGTPILPQVGYQPSQAGYFQAAYPPPGGHSVSPGSTPLQHVDTNDKDPMVDGLNFSTESIRRGFIRKVYSILSVQLTFTLGCVFLLTWHEPSRLFAQDNMWLAITAIIIGFSTILAISCCESVRHTSPHNLIVLGIFTLAEGYVVGVSTLYADPIIVLQAVGLTAIVVVGLTIFAMQTKWDFTMMGGILFVALLLFIFVSLMVSLTGFGQSNAGGLILSSFGALLFAVYLIYDTQLIMGGKHDRQFQLTPEEYILGAVMLYLDIINLFLHLLRILSALQKQ